MLVAPVVILSAQVQRRNLLRLTAKSTQFGKKTFTSWLIESAGTLPIQRRKDFVDGQIDNNDVMQHLLKVSVANDLQYSTNITGLCVGTG